MTRPSHLTGNPPAKGTVLLLTLMMLVLLTFEVATISLVAQRGLGDESVLHSQNISARRGTEVALNRIEESLYHYLLTNAETNALTAYGYGGTNDIDNLTLTVVNPSTGATENTEVTIWGWLAERRGPWYKIAGRAKLGGVDLIAYRWVRLNPCRVASTGLQTLVTGMVKPGYSSTAVSADGRVFFAESEATNAIVWSWHESTGLSTIITDGVWPGRKSIIADNDGRVFFGEHPNAATGRFFTWRDNILSTIFSSQEDVGVNAIAISPLDGRVYFGQEKSANAQMWTWRNNILSTIVTNQSQPGFKSIYVSPQNGAVAFGETAGASSSLWYWSVGTGLSTIMPSSNQAGLTGDEMPIAMQSMSLSTSDPGRIFFGGPSDQTLWTWKANILSTIVTGAGAEMGRGGILTTSDGRVIAGSENRVLTWKDGILSTIMSVGNIWPYEQKAAMDADGRIFFSDESSPAGLYSWSESSGLSTIGTMPSGAWLHHSVYGSAAGRFFIGMGTGGSSGAYYTWKPGSGAGTGLSTLVSGVTGIGFQAGGTYVNNTAYFGSNEDPSSLWRFSETTGLSTIATGIRRPGAGNRSLMVNPADGSVYFGQDGSSGENGNGSFWSWAPPLDCNLLGF